MTAIKRKELMDKLQQTALETPIPVRDTEGNFVYENGNIKTLTLSSSPSESEWTAYRNNIKHTPTYQSTYKYLTDTYTQVEQDITSTRRRISAQASGNYLKNAAAAAIATSAVKYGIDTIHNINNPNEIIHSSSESVTQS